MLEESDIETIAKEVFREFGLKWKVLQKVEYNAPHQRWWVRAIIVPDHPDVFAEFYLNKGPRDVVKNTLAEMVKRKLQELESK